MSGLLGDDKEGQENVHFTKALRVLKSSEEEDEFLSNCLTTSRQNRCCYTRQASARFMQGHEEPKVHQYNEAVSTATLSYLPLSTCRSASHKECPINRAAVADVT